MDISTQVPGLLEKLDQLQRIRFPQERQLQSLQLLYHCWMLDTALQEWYQEVQSRFGTETSVEPWYTKECSQADSPFPSEIHFKDQIHAQAFIFYWSTCVLVYSTMQKLDHSLRSTAASEMDPALSSAYNGLPTCADPYQPVAHIVQTIPYFLQPSVGLLTRKIFVGALAIAYAYFASFPNRSVPTCSSNTTKSPTSTSSGATESSNRSAIAGSLTAPKDRDVDIDVVKTYLETTVKAMHIRGLQMNIFCGPPSADDSLVLKEGWLKT